MSFDDNVDFIKELAQKIPSKMTLIVLYRPDTEAAATDLAAFGLITRPFRDGVKFVFDLVPLLMSAKLIICDNYYAFLGGLHRRRDTKIVQIWHAAGQSKSLVGKIGRLLTAASPISSGFKRSMTILTSILLLQKRWEMFL